MNKFTLIELLVVIAIIGVLISILLPSLENSRRIAKIAVCKSQLHQFAIASQSYASDNKSWLPHGQASLGTAYGCFAVLTEDTKWFGHGNYFKLGYLDERSVYHCPGGSKAAHQYGGSGGSYGGFTTAPNALRQTTVSSYNYRSSFEIPYRQFNLTLDSGDYAYMSDHFAGLYNQDCHLAGFNVLYIDSSINFKKTNFALNNDISSNDYATQEVVWQSFDR